eukprot:TRINITY_DN40897_c0_g1_i1.p1 TRINITY_DN40897_c0_g1~~TRINITY_DN40897_c0_g1_i1.p1  ORF type:complete len:375 (+),score=129.25 TRINITY_DN40897_c0_g1_i1:57-1181(+)
MAVVSAIVAAALAARLYPHGCCRWYTMPSGRSTPAKTPPDVRSVISGVGLDPILYSSVGRIDVYNWSAGACSCCATPPPVTHRRDEIDMLQTPDEVRKPIRFAQFTQGRRDQFYYGEPYADQRALGVLQGRRFCGPWYSMVWQRLIPAGSVAIDIGTDIGDTTVPLAHATKGGTTIAIEAVSAHYQMLVLQSRLNPHLKIIPHLTAVTNEDNITVRMTGQTMHKTGGRGAPVIGRRLTELLKEKHGVEVLRRVSFIKIDCEGHDPAIVESIQDLLRMNKPALWIEWFAPFKGSSPDACSADSKNMFDIIEKAGYVAYQSCTQPRGLDARLCEWPPKKSRGCQNKNWETDLLLLPKENTPDKWAGGRYEWKGGDL